MNRRRLDFEATRDSLLVVSGQLDFEMEGRSVDINKAPFSRRRTVYGYIARQNLPSLFRTFDFASPDTTCPQRHSTTVPQQALFLMNSPFVVEKAQSLARRVTNSSPHDKVVELYQLVFARNPEAIELAAGTTFIASQESGSESRLTVWEQYAQVLLLANEFSFVD